ncbi:MAG: flagellar basal body L-ring protein FlgH [Acidobacteria bacterium]|nr:flagellar basal body L-ring protein FlgH [Acidobacteriota bacterium]
MKYRWISAALAALRVPAPTLLAALRFPALALLAALAALLFPAPVHAETKTRSPLEQYIDEALRADPTPAQSAGSLYVAGGRLGDLARDPRATQVNDLVTIVVSDRASAVARGSSSSARKSSASNSITAALGTARVGPLANLANLGGESQLDGSGETSRATELNTTLSARITHVLPNGYLVLAGTKEIVINSERQVVTVRGIARVMDLSASNQIRSDRLANLEVHVLGKGLVNDAIRRPNFLYRFLLGLLPF